MKGLLWAGLLAVGMGSAACRGEPESVAAREEARDEVLLPGTRRALEPAVQPEPGGEAAPQSGQGGAGQAGIPQEWRGCTRALASPEPSSVVTGQVRRASKDLLTLEDRTGRRMDLHADTTTCLLWNEQPVQPSQLSEGVTVRVAFEVDPEDGATARVVRVIEQQRPAP